MNDYENARNIESGKYARYKATTGNEHLDAFRKECDYCGHEAGANWARQFTLNECAAIISEHQKRIRELEESLKGWGMMAGIKESKNE